MREVELLLRSSIVLSIALLASTVVAAPVSPESSWPLAPLEALACPALSMGGLGSADGERCHAWAARYDDPGVGPDDASDLAVSPTDGRVFMTGLTDDVGFIDALTVAFEPTNGLVAWSSRVDLLGLEGGTDAVVSPDGGTLYVGGNVVEGSYDYLVLALDAASGALRWSQRYEGPGDGYDRIEAIAVDAQRVYVTGSSAGAGTSFDLATLALDAATGEIDWVARVDGPAHGEDQARALAVAEGRVFVTGALQTGAAWAHRDYVTLAYDAATGAEIWRALYAGPRGADTAMALATDGTTVVVTGDSLGEENLETVTVAYDAATGATRWAARYGGPPGADIPREIALTPDGSRALVVGRSDKEWSWSDEASDAVTIAYDVASGAEAWVARYDGPIGGYDEAFDITVSADGDRAFVSGIATTGPAELAPNGPWRDALTLAYDIETGAEMWRATHDGVLGGGDSGHAIGLSSAGDRVFVGGQTLGTDGTDFLLLAYDTD